VRDVLDEYRRWAAEGVGAGRAVVVRVVGSAPRPAGGTLLVADDGRIAGSISGGCVEGAAVDEVTAARRGGYRTVVQFGITDEQALGVGLACGGTIEVLVEPEVGAELEAAAAGPGGAAVVVRLPSGRSDAATRRLVVRADGTLAGSLGNAALDGRLGEFSAALIATGVSSVVDIESEEFFIEVFPAPPRLVVVGAGQVAIHLVSLAHEMGFQTVVVDARGAFATHERFPLADAVLVGWPDELADRAGIDRDAAVVVLSHEARFDEPAIVAAFERGARYVGAIGSRDVQAMRRERLRAAGVGEEQLMRLRAPIGLDLGGRTPPEVALAIMAEIVADRHAATGGRLSARREVAPGEVAPSA